MTSAKLDLATKECRNSKPQRSRTNWIRYLENSIKEPDSAIDTPPERTSGGPFQWNLK
jgi:hypothetical protein